VSLDGIWDFIPDSAARFAPDSLPAGDQIAVPGPWEATHAEPYGIVHAWYRRRFTTPADWEDGTLLFRFGSVMARAAVYLDGRLLGRSEDGYLPFELEAGAATPGSDHELAVAVDNPLNALTRFPASDDDMRRTAEERLGGRTFDDLAHGKQAWYTSTSGLLGSVVAELAPTPRFATLVVLPDLARGRALVRWRTVGAAGADPGRIEIAVTSPGGKVVARAEADGRIGEIEVEVPDAEPWDIGRPRFYRVDARLGGITAGSSAVGSDEASTRFGMRSIAVRDGGILFNDRPIYVRGVLDQDLWPVGLSNPPSREALAAQLELVRQMGFNLLRCHIKIPDPAYLDGADEAGLLVWCEVPSWRRFDIEAADRARRMLTAMVETMGSHPSVVAWTVINEDWGTDLRHSARDRRWLRTTVDWLKALDPTRLVVDNSACDSDGGPNFHLRSDLADFHAYRSTPDGSSRWRSLIADFARRPGWLWSPYGDASPTGDEALVLSEFGGWGLPRPSAVRRLDGHEPWWWTTGVPPGRPADVERRFLEQGLDRIWPDLDALAEATQWRQYEGLAEQIGVIREQSAIAGYVVTQLSDTGWEANGVLDAERGRKVYHDRLREPNGPDVLVIRSPRSDVWGGDRLDCEVTLSSFPDTRDGDADDDAEIRWHLGLDDGATWTGSGAPVRWPRAGVNVTARIGVDVPDVETTTSGELVVTALAAHGRGQAASRRRLVVVPAASRRTARPRRVSVVDPLGLWPIERRLRSLGHDVVDVDRSELIVASRLESSLLAEVDRGHDLLLVARSTDAIPAGLGLARSIAIRRRRPGDGTSAYATPLDGDWIGVFAWALPDTIPGLPAGGLLGDAQREVYPDHVIDGLDPGVPQDEVAVGIFAGWLHSPAALLGAFGQGAGRIVVTTLHVAPEDGPVATALLETLIRRTVEPTGGPRRPAALEATR
jgi:hypothetical protein